MLLYVFGEKEGKGRRADMLSARADCTVYSLRMAIRNEP